MRLPGFSGEMSLYVSSRHYRAVGGARQAHGVSAQVIGGGFHSPLGAGGLSTVGDALTCKQGCAAARATCLDTCEGTWENPKPSRNCWLCDDDYRACVSRCTEDIA